MIETERLWLRVHQESDLEYLHQILSDSETVAFWLTPFTRAQTEGWIAKQIKSHQENGIGRFVVILKEEDKIIGDCGIMKTEIEGKLENDLGYIIYAKYWYHGYGYEAAKKSLEYGFSQLGLTSIYANMAYNHQASIKVAEKIGMRRVKEFYNKKNRDILTYLYEAEIDNPHK